MAISIGGIVVTKLLADQAGVQPDRQGQLLLFGGLLGYSPVGILVTSQLIQQEVAAETQSTTTSTGTTGTTGGSLVQVPDVRNLSLAAAQQQLVSLGLRTQTLNAASSSAQKGLVINQDPTPGATVATGSLVTLTISQGISLPDVTGQFIEPAQATLQVLGLQVQTSRQRAEASADIVIGENPAAGSSVSPGSLVTLTVSQGPNISVPDVVQTRSSDAQKALSDAGLQAKVVSQGSQSVNKDFVISQDPAAGTAALPGDVVTLTVSSGEGIQVPDLTNQTAADALKKLKELKLVAALTQESSAAVVAGFVIRQDPAAGQTVPPGATITLVVSQGDTTGSAELPDFTGHRYNQAREVLQDLEIKQARKNVPSDMPAGTIVGQDPAPGTISAGITVTLFVSTGKPD